MILFDVYTAPGLVLWANGIAAGGQHQTIMWKAKIVYFTLFPPDTRKGRKILCSELSTEVGTS